MGPKLLHLHILYVHVCGQAYYEDVCINVELNFMARCKHFFNGSVIKKETAPGYKKPYSYIGIGI